MEKDNYSLAEKKILLSSKRQVTTVNDGNTAVNPVTKITKTPVQIATAQIMDHKVDAILPSPDTLAKPMGTDLQKIYMQAGTPDDPLVKTLKNTGVIGPTLEANQSKVLPTLKEVVEAPAKLASFTFSNPWIMGGMVLGVIALWYFSKR